MQQFSSSSSPPPSPDLSCGGGQKECGQAASGDAGGGIGSENDVSSLADS